jgi:ferrous iron transport protein A
MKGWNMMPLAFAKAGEVNSIKKIGGKDETKRFLNNLGFVEGGEIIIVSENAGNLIVNVKNTRVAISKEMANRIVV